MVSEKRKALWREAIFTEKVGTVEVTYYGICDSCGRHITEGQLASDREPYWFWNHPVCKNCFNNRGFKLYHKWKYELNAERYDKALEGKNETV